MEKANLKKLIEEDWQIQGFISTPLYLLPCANSGFVMDNLIGVRYETFLFHFKKEYCEMYYNNNDLKHIWSHVYDQYLKNKNYFKHLRKNYEKLQQGHSPLIKELATTDLHTLDGAEFFKLFQAVLQMVFDTVNIGQVIEAFSMLHDQELLEITKKHTLDKKNQNMYLELLSSPVTKTWINESDANLSKIRKAPVEKQLELLKEHTKKYYWIKNNYFQAKPLEITDFRDEMEKLKDIVALNYDKIKSDKTALMVQLGLSEKEKEVVHFIEFFADFQDDRKKNILKALHHLEEFVNETSMRYGIPADDIKFLLPEEISKPHINQDVKKIIEQRKKGMLIVSTVFQNEIFVGKELHDIEKWLKIHHDETKELHGMVASSGTAVGRAKVCKSIHSLTKVEQGDILVASMTRPEYITAMKKASAIVTDEGGITCHAAIVSRELGIPCVIGTKNATKVIKDGDYLEVKGNHGLVIILKD